MLNVINRVHFRWRSGDYCFKLKLSLFPTDNALTKDWRGLVSTPFHEAITVIRRENKDSDTDTAVATVIMLLFCFLKPDSNPVAGWEPQGGGVK